MKEIHTSGTWMIHFLHQFVDKQRLVANIWYHPIFHEIRRSEIEAPLFMRLIERTFGLGLLAGRVHTIDEDFDFRSPP